METLVQPKNPLQTFKDINVNKVSDQVIGFLNKNKLGPKECKRFRLIKKKINPDPQKKAGPFLYPNISIQTHFWINDPENGPTEIALTKGIQNGNLLFKKFHVDGQYTKDGIFNLWGNNIEDVALYPILLLSPQNDASEFKDSNVEPIFEPLDDQREAKKKIVRFEKLNMCLTLISEMDMSDLRLYNTANGGNIDDTEEMMRALLNDLALKDAEAFYTMAGNPITKIKALIKQAADANVIQYDPQQHRYLWVKGQTTIAPLDRIEGLEPSDQFAEWLNNSKDGPSVQILIENHLTGAKKPKKP